MFGNNDECHLLCSEYQVMDRVFEMRSHRSHNQMSIGHWLMCGNSGAHKFRILHFSASTEHTCVLSSSSVIGIVTQTQNLLLNIK